MGASYIRKLEMPVASYSYKRRLSTRIMGPVLFVLVTVACSSEPGSEGSASPSTPSTAAPAVSPPIANRYAYIKSNQVGLVEDGKITARQNINLNGELDRSDYTWSHSGRYFAFFNSHPLTDQERADRSIYVLDANTKTISALPCPNCGEMSPIDDNGLLVDQPGGGENAPQKVLRVDLEGSRTLNPVKLSLPDDLQEFSLIAGVGDSVLVIADGRGSQMDRRVYLTGVSRRPTLIATSDSQSYWIRAHATSSQGGQGRIAIAASSDEGCGLVPRIDIVATTTGEVTSTDTSEVVAPEMVGPKALNFDIEDLWWTPDRVLYASFFTWDCAHGFPDASKTSTQVYRLDDSRWKKVDDTFIVSRLEFKDGSQAIVIPTTDPLERENTGDPVKGVLHHHIGSDDKELAKDVLAILMAPQ